jgi:hypothetical protein
VAKRTRQAPPDDDAERVEPRLGDALIGSAIGFLLIYGGSFIPYWILRWAVMAVGAVFVLVMIPFAGFFLWQRVAPSLVPKLRRAVGHVRHDPQLGRLTRDAGTESWSAVIQRGDRQVEFTIGGTAKPSPPLVARARALLADFDAFERRVAEFVTGEVPLYADAPELQADVEALRIREIQWWIEEPDKATIVFDGLDEDIYWSCVFERGELSDLDHD